MRALRFAWAFSLLLIVGAGAEEPVQFADPRLKAAIEEALWITNPTPTDMLSLTELNCVRHWSERGDGEITNLDGLEYATNLYTLNLRLNYVSDISALAGLTNLAVLDVSQNHVTNLSPLSGLVHLGDLNLHGNGVSDISALSGLTSLSVLNLRLNSVSDISPLAGLLNLRDLDLAVNQIRDISPLCGLTSLAHLNIQGNPLPQEAYDVLIPQIIANNPGISISRDPGPGRWLTVTSTAGGTVVEPGEGEFKFDYDVSVRLLAAPAPGFVFTGWSGTVATEANPAYLTMSLNHQIQANFAILLEVLHVDDDAPGDPGPGDPAESDPHENGTAEHPFDRIQEAIEVAGGAVTILVHDGIYRENIDCLGKDIQLIGAGPNGPGAPPYPVLEAAQAGSVVRCSGRSGQPRLLSGLVISAGKDRTAGALLARDTSLTLNHCLLVGNRSTDPNGAALYASDSDIVAANCTIADNSGGPESAAVTLVRSHLTLTNSILWDDTPVEVLVLDANEPDIRYCAVRGWRADAGNIHVDPLFARRGRWIDPEKSEQVLEPQNSGAVWAPGDYHLQSQAGRWNPDTQAWVRNGVTSPCIDRGDKSTPVGNEPAPHGGIINMGAYGGTSEASKSP